MGPGGAGCHNHPIEFFPDHGFLDQFLGILGAGVQIVHIDHYITEIGSIPGDICHVDNAGYILAAIAYKDANAQFFLLNRTLLRKLFFCNNGSAARGQQFRSAGGSAAGLHH